MAGGGTVANHRAGAAATTPEATLAVTSRPAAVTNQATTMSTAVEGYTRRLGPPRTPIRLHEKSGTARTIGAEVAKDRAEVAEAAMTGGGLILTIGLLATTRRVAAVQAAAAATATTPMGVALAQGGVAAR